MRSHLLLATLLCSSFAGATEWHVLGPRATAMGGAGVALPQGAQSAYWNPASLGLADNPSGLQIPVGAHMGISGTVLAGANDLKEVEDACQAGNMAVCTQANITSALNELNNPNNGARVDIGGGAGVKIGKVSVFANNFFFAGGKPIIDLVHSGTDANTQATFVGNNTSRIDLRGLNVTEFGAAYGRELPFAPGLNAGVALKGMIGRTGFQQLLITETDSGNGIGNVMKNSRSSFQPGVDVGLLWNVNRSFESAWFKPRLGLTARNINNPKFKNPDAATAAGAPSKYSLQGNARMGVAISPLKFWNIAADADLTRNLTAVEGVKQQSIGVGTEINVFNRSWLNIPLRTGLSKNIAQSGSKTALSAGVGFNFLHAAFDVGASVTPGRQSIQTQGQSKKLPNELGVAGQFAIQFGGTDDDLGPEKP